jgi:hypothetical protein
VITKIRDKSYSIGNPGWEIGEEKNACEACKDRIVAGPERPALEGKVNFTLSERAQAALADLYHDPFRDEAPTDSGRSVT